MGKKRKKQNISLKKKKKRIVAHNEIIHKGDNPQWMNSFDERLMGRFIIELSYLNH